MQIACELLTFSAVKAQITSLSFPNKPNERMQLQLGEAGADIHQM